MAIIISNDGNKDVANIAARDALTYKFPGMEVFVLDTVADPLTGGGSACYKWNAITNKWMLMWKNSKDSLMFTFESKTIVNGQVTADFLPKDGIVWEVRVLNSSGIIIGDFNPTVTGSVIDIGTTDYDGNSNTIQYNYAYGAIESAIAASSQPLHASLTNIAALSGTTGLLKKTATDTWILDTTPLQTYDAQLSSLVPQNSKSVDYTTVLTDSAKHILHPAADITARTFTIAANSAVAYPIGTAISFVNQNAAGVLTIAIDTDTLRLAGPGTTGNRTLAANGVATALKVTATEWLISGTGLT